MRGAAVNHGARGQVRLRQSQPRDAVVLLANTRVIAEQSSWLGLDGELGRAGGRLAHRVSERQ
jgi:hypothetical protein